MRCWSIADRLQRTCPRDLNQFAKPLSVLSSTGKSGADASSAILRCCTAPLPAGVTGSASSSGLTRQQNNEAVYRLLFMGIALQGSRPCFERYFGSLATLAQLLLVFPKALPFSQLCSVPGGLPDARSPLDSSLRRRKRACCHHSLQLQEPHLASHCFELS